MGVVFAQPERPPDVDLLPPRFAPPAEPLERLHVAPVSMLVGRGELGDLLTRHFVDAPPLTAFGGIEGAGVAGAGWAAKAADDDRDVDEVAALAAMGIGPAAMRADAKGFINLELGMVPSLDNDPPEVGLLFSRAAEAQVAASLKQTQLAKSPAWTAQAVIGNTADISARGSMHFVDSGIGVHGALHATGPAKASAGGSGGSGTSRRVVGRDGVLDGAVAGVRWGTFGESGSLSVGASADLQKGGEGWVSATRGNVRGGVRVSRGWAAGSPVRGLAAVSMVRSETIGDATQPSFEVGLSTALDGSRQVASYHHRLVTRRSIINPMAKAHEKGIWNYVDVGFALQHAPHEAEQLGFAFGAAMQFNRTWMAKVRATPDSFSSALVFKTWMDPMITVAVGNRVDLSTGKSTPGLNISLTMGRKVQYERAKSTAVRRVRSKRTQALEEPAELAPEPAFPGQPEAPNVPKGDHYQRPDVASDSVSRLGW